MSDESASGSARRRLAGSDPKEPVTTGLFASKPVHQGKPAKNHKYDCTDPGDPTVVWQSVQCAAKTKATSALKTAIPPATPAVTRLDLPRLAAILSSILFQSSAQQNSSL
jgi:hypothetical protein